MRIRWLRVTGLVVVAAAIVAAVGTRHTSSSTSTTASRAHVPRGQRDAPGGTLGLPPLRPDDAVLSARAGGVLGEADGAIPAGTTVFDERVPGVTRLAPALLGALRRAATDAAGEGVAFVLDSGWRSTAHQAQLLQAAVAKYGSEAEASRWVAPPDRSAHVSGDAVDLGSAASAWLRENGAHYGLCRIYANEPWHFELRPEAIDLGCPAVYADPTHDPRMEP